MPQVTYVQPNGAERSVAGKIGDSVMNIAVQNDVPGIVAECGGVLSCGTCHVYVDPAWVDRVPPPGEDERDMLENTRAEQRDSSRLSCQIKLTPDLDGLRVSVPEDQ